MGDNKDLDRKEAIEKLRKMADDINICMFCTASGNGLPFETRPMSTIKADENGKLWFFSSAASYKNREVNAEEHVQLIYSKPSTADFMVVYGKGYIRRDKQIIDELWNNYIKAWFPEGKDDPALTVIEVVPDEAYYWDTKHGRMISFLKILTAAATGIVMDDGIEGRLNVNS